MKIKSSASQLGGEIVIPASKSHTIRAVAIAAIAKGKSVLKNPLLSDDARSAIGGAKEMGAIVELGRDWIISGTGGVIGPHCRHIDVGNSGTSLRILTALSALSGQPISFDGDKSIRQRPMLPLLSSLENLGVKVIESSDGKCPFTIQGPLLGGKTRVNGISFDAADDPLEGCRKRIRSDVSA